MTPRDSPRPKFSTRTHIAVTPSFSSQCPTQFHSLFPFLGVTSILSILILQYRCTLLVNIYKRLNNPGIYMVVSCSVSHQNNLNQSGCPFSLPWGAVWSESRLDHLSGIHKGCLLGIALRSYKFFWFMLVYSSLNPVY